MWLELVRVELVHLQQLEALLALALLLQVQQRAQQRHIRQLHIRRKRHSQCCSRWSSQSNRHCRRMFHIHDDGHTEKHGNHCHMTPDKLAGSLKHRPADSWFRKLAGSWVHRLAAHKLADSWKRAHRMTRSANEPSVSGNG